MLRKLFVLLIGIFVLSTPVFSYTECDYNAPVGQNGCPSGQECWEIPVYDAGGNKAGSVGSCIADTNDQCTLPSNTDYSCSTSTGCSMGSYCLDGGLFGNDLCFEVNPNVPSPATCFSSIGNNCGSAVPSTGWAERIYCKQGNYCASYDASATQPFKKALYSDYANYPVSGTCIKCVASGGDCTGDAQLANGAIDDCCDPNMRCGVDNKCHQIFQPSFCSGQIPTPGSLCKAYGSNENYCDLCPASVGGDNTVESPSGDIYCAEISYQNPYNNTGTILSSCNHDCGCPNGYNCNGGSCVAENTCVSPGGDCSTSGTACCDPDSVDYTCTFNPNLYRTTCQSPECDLVKQTLQCTEATEDCCPDHKPFCNNGTCGEAFECTSEGECCPGYGMVCDANKQCVPSTDGECETEDNVLPPAPAYLGPKISITDLFSAIGAILYPAGIGIGLFFIVRAGYIIMMSEGSPDEVKKGQEYLTSAVIGTLFIVLSGSILRIIINTLLG